MLARADAVAPAITQVIVENDTIKIEMSEETSFEPIEIVLNRLNLATTGSTAPTKAAVSLAVTQPIQEGRRARRRLHLAPTTAPTPGETVELTIQPSGVQDLFNNPLSSVYTTSFPWPDPAGPAV